MTEAEAQHEPKEKTVLIAMDGSRHAIHALEWYMEHLALMSDKVIIAYCAESSTGLSPTMLMAGNPIVIQQVAKHQEEEVNKVLDTLDKLAKMHKIHHKIELLYGSPGEAVIQFAEQQNVDMIVTGSRGHGLIRRTIMGSVSDYIVHHCRVPVLICKYDEHQK